MIIIPAVDIKGGRCVRLRQGRAEDCTVYSDDPVEMAKRWVDAGGEYLHVVDLDGAFEGAPVNTEVIKRIAREIDIPVEVGGGLRTDEHVRELLEAGIARAIIGTRAISDRAGMERLASKLGRNIAVGIDARDGMVQVNGWVETTDTAAVELAQDLEAMGVSTFIYTDTSRDGMLKGVNLDAVAEFCDAVKCDVIASGGVTGNDDIIGLNRLNRRNLAGVIVGKALYDGRIDLREIKALV